MISLKIEIFLIKRTYLHIIFFWHNNNIIIASFILYTISEYILEDQQSMSNESNWIICFRSILDFVKIIFDVGVIYIFTDILRFREMDYCSTLCMIWLWYTQVQYHLLTRIYCRHNEVIKQLLFICLHDGRCCMACIITKMI